MNTTNKNNIGIVAQTLFLVGTCALASDPVLAANATTARLTAETNARKVADNTETNARIAADNNLKTQLTTEQSARQAAILQLQAQINSSALPPLPPGQFQVSLTRCGNSNTPQWGPCLYAIGDTGPAGGFVFYVTGGGLHGLEAAPVDQSNAIWGCFGAFAGLVETAVGTGAANTAAIVAGCAEQGIAAKVADAYSLNGYEDWFLPSKDEMNLMDINIGPRASAPLTNVGGFGLVVGYWSSSATPILGVAWFQDFSAGFQGAGIKSDTHRVRAVRAF